MLKKTKYIFFSVVILFFIMFFNFHITKFHYQKVEDSTNFYIATNYSSFDKTSNNFFVEIHFSTDIDKLKLRCLNYKFKNDILITKNVHGINIDELPLTAIDTINTYVLS